MRWGHVASLQMKLVNKEAAKSSKWVRGHLIFLYKHDLLMKTQKLPTDTIPYTCKHTLHGEEASSSILSVLHSDHPT